MFESNFDLTEVDKALADVDARSKRMAPAFRALGRPMRHDQKVHAKAQAGPDGPWPARSPATEARRKKRNRRNKIPKALRTISAKPMRSRSTPKRVLGKLPAAIVVKTGPLFVRGYSRVKWGSAHYGARVGRHRRVRLPRRAFYWISEALLGTARDVIGAYVVKGWKR